MKKILVYGDSIPWGLIPATKFERYDSSERWPGLLQNKLGGDYQIIEECLCARTIDSDDIRPGFEGRNGITTLPTILDSHWPIDTVILSLGLNEIKSLFNWTPAEVAEKLGRMIDLIKNRKPNFHEYNPRIIILSQPEVYNTGAWGELWVGSNEKSRQLFNEYKNLAELKGVEFVDLSSIKPDDTDGVHIDDIGHQQIAEKLAQVI